MWVYFQTKEKSAQLRELMGLDPVSLVTKKGRYEMVWTRGM